MKIRGKHCFTPLPVSLRRRPERGCLHQVEDDDAAIGIVLVGFGRSAWGWVTVERELEPRLIALPSLAILLFSLSNLLDDERR